MKFFLLNLLICFVLSFFLNLSESNTEIIFLDKEIESPTLKYSTQSPPTSLKISISEHITGRENDKASRIGIPNPSSNEGQTYNNAFLYNKLDYALETYPAKITLFSNLFSIIGCSCLTIMTLGSFDESFSLT